MAGKTIYQFKVKNLKGEAVDLSLFRNKVVLIVNTASACGFTPQLAALENLYREYRDKGFEIIAFPSNDFREQEPLKPEEIQEFCSVNYGVTFPVMGKIAVKGEDSSELFRFLGTKSLNGKFSSKPRWNFHKYLIDREGQVSDYFYTFTSPNSKKIKKAIENLL